MKKLQQHKISIDELKTLLLNSTGAVISTLDTKTIPRMRKTNNPFIGDCFKVSTVNVIINFNYENSVNRQRDREESATDFKGQERKWGTYEGGVFVQHKGNMYLQAKVEKVLNTKYIHEDGSLYSESDVSKLKEYFPPHNPSKTQDLQREVVMRNYKIDNIIGIRCYGKSYKVLHEGGI